MGKKLTKEEFIKKAKELYEDKYDYSKVEYKNSRTKVCIILPGYGEFWQRPNGHLCGKCPEFDCKALRTAEFIRKAREVHGDKYDYSKAEYKNAFEKVCIICPHHGEFWQEPHSHLRGSGCPKCRSSHGETMLRLKFQENNINFVEQETWDWLVYETNQYVDFYIPDKNLVVEFQGEQHFVERTHRPLFDDGLGTIILRDQNKKKLCEERGIKVIYFSNMTKVLGKDFKYPYDVIEDIDELIRIINETPSIDVS